MEPAGGAGVPSTLERSKINVDGFDRSPHDTEVVEGMRPYPETASQRRGGRGVAMTSAGRKRVVVVGGSFGGVNAAYEPPEAFRGRRITVISRDAEFTSSLPCLG